MDLSGKIVFKVKLDNEIKKLVIHNDDINYNEMLLMMQRIFSNKIKPHDEFIIKYTDEENDLITLSNDSDVLLALQNSKILKLTIFLNDQEEKVEEVNPTEIVKELKNIRTSIDSFLEKFDMLLRSDKYKPRVEEMIKAVHDAKMPTSNGNISTILNVHKEFDPLSKKHESGENHKPPSTRRESRAHSPESVGSLELSPNPKKFDQFTSSQNVPQQQQQQQHQQQQQYANMNLNSLNGNHDKPIHMQQPTNSIQDQNTYYQQLQHQQHPHTFPPFNQQPPQQQQQQQQPPVQQVPPPIQQQHQQQAPPNQMQQPPQHQPQATQFYSNLPTNQPGKPNQPPNQMPFPGQMDQIPQQPIYHNQAPNQQPQQQPAPPNWHMQQQPVQPPMHQQQGPPPPQQQQQQPPMMTQQVNSGFMSGSNPYAKTNPVVHRPPSATMYQQGYK